METVIPRLFDDRSKTCDSALVVPEMTAVSKPNSKPPNAATTVLFSNTEFNFMPSPSVPSLVGGTWLQQSSNRVWLRGGWQPARQRDSRSPQCPGWATPGPNREEMRQQRRHRRRPHPQLERDSRVLQYIVRSEEPRSPESRG